MRTVKEVSELTGVSVRTLRYYDSIGLLRPSAYTEAGYRLYDDAALARLQQILLYKSLEFPLKAISAMMDAPDFDRDQALDQQIELLTMKKAHLEALIDHAREIKNTGGASIMDFTAFDTQKMDEYTAQAKARWGKTAAYKEYEEKSKERSDAEQQILARDLMQIFAEFGTMRNFDPADESVQQQVKKLQDYITAHYYQCTKPILSGLGQMYTTAEFAENIDQAGGSGTAQFVSEAIAVYTKGK